MNIVTEYDNILNKLDDIVKTLQLNTGARYKLRRLYQRKKWLDIAARPTEDELVRLALDRIKQDPIQFDLFIDMLRDTEGMDLIVTTLTGGELRGSTYLIPRVYNRRGGEYPTTVCSVLQPFTGFMTFVMKFTNVRFHGLLTAARAYNAERWNMLEVLGD